MIVSGRCAFLLYPVGAESFLLVYLIIASMHRHTHTHNLYGCSHQLSNKTVKCNNFYYKYKSQIKVSSKVHTYFMCALRASFCPFISGIKILVFSDCSWWPSAIVCCCDFISFHFALFVISNRWYCITSWIGYWPFIFYFHGRRSEGVVCMYAVWWMLCSVSA